MSVKDMIKSGVYESFAGGSGLHFGEVCLILALSFLIGSYIFFVYKSFSKSAFYSKDLNITMAGMGIVVAAIMIAMQSNLLVSLGMVGALSIVRFRTAVKNPIDLLYLFWAISAGIICGVGLYVLAACLCIIMTIAIFLWSRVPASKAPALLIITSDNDIDLHDIEKVIKTNCSYHHQTTILTKNGEMEIIYEIKTKNAGTLIKALPDVENVKSVNYLEHDGEVRA